MKTDLSRFRLSLTSLALLLAAVSPAAAASREHDARLDDDFSSLRIVDDDDYEDFGFDKLKGNAVRGADGKQFGRIRDFVIDARSGEVRFAVVSSGRLIGAGDSRLLPFEALRRDADDRGFITRLQQYDWQLLPTIDRDDLKAGRIVLNPEHRRNLSQVKADWVRAFDALSDGSDPDSVYRNVLASRITGKSLHTNNQQVGEIEDVVFNFDRRIAGVLIETDPDFAGAEEDVIVPLKSLQFAPGDSDRIHTNLSANDFQKIVSTTAPDIDRRQARSETPWARRPGDRDNRAPIAPTGAPSGYGAVNQSAIESAARTVQQAWESEPDLARLNLKARAEQNRLILEGKVPNQRLWDRAQRAADDVVSRITIENRIKIE